MALNVGDLIPLSFGSNIDKFEEWLEDNVSRDVQAIYDAVIYLGLHPHNVPNDIVLSRTAGKYKVIFDFDLTTITFEDK